MLLVCFFLGEQRTGLLSNLDQAMIDKISKIDVASSPYTYIFPKMNPDGSLYLGTGVNEIELLVYIIQSLKTTPKPVRLTPMDYEIFRRIMSPHFNELRNLVQSYIFSNDKSVIEKIKKLMTSEDREAMLSSIQFIKTVYRGIGWDEGSYTNDEIRKSELKTRYVSTTPKISTADRFSRGVGHLERGSVNRIHRAILTYDISNKNAVVLSTAIFGEAFNESDILIDTTIAKLVEIERK